MLVLLNKQIPLFKHCALQCTKNGIRRIFSVTGTWPKHLENEHLHAIEEKWKDVVPNEVKKAQATLSEPVRTRYVLSMFPYPSGQLHMGHVRVYAISDAMAHYHRFMKHKVIHPMGWDAFGLPAENAAIERQIQPQVWTETNIASMKEQLQSLCCLFDWEREIATCDPNYYRWTQWFFLQMLKHGLAYQKNAMVNWDPVDQTVLADEQVDEEGRSWRSGALVERKPLKQWFLRTTRFSKDLYEGLDDPSLQNWQEVIKLQKHWIGECNGIRVDFKLTNGEDFVTAWTDKPELLEQATFVGLSPGHILDRKDLQLKRVRSENHDVTTLNVCAVNPLNGLPIPILVLNNSNANAPEAELWYANSDPTAKEIAILCNVCNDVKDARPLSTEEVTRRLVELNAGGFWCSSKLNDWLISRQRYWGTPIPIVHCPTCGAVPVKESDLPVVLPVLNQLSAKGVSPLVCAEDWLNTPCPSCGSPAKRETDTMDTFVDSSWYFARYLDPKNTEEAFSKKASEHLPVDLYIGGKEHAIMHMYFARFFTHFMHYIDLSPTKEPFQNLLVQGMVKGKSYRTKSTGKYISPDDVVVDQMSLKSTGEPVIEDWEKMSKSKHNGVDPGKILRYYGSDTTKLLILSDVSPQSDRKWNPEDSHKRIEGMQRKIWKLVLQAIDLQKRTDLPVLSSEEFNMQVTKCWDARNYYVRGVNNAYRTSFNFAMIQARVQGMLGDLFTVHGRVKRDSAEFQRALGTAIILLAPMAPHFCSELWYGLCKGLTVKHCQHFDWNLSLFHQAWPEMDDNYNLKMIVNVDGEPLSEIPIALWRFRHLETEEAFDIACCDEKVQELVLPRDFSHTFVKMEDYEAQLNFRVKRSPEELKQMKQDKKDAKKLRKLKRKERLEKTVD